MCMTRTVIGTGGVVDFEDLENENQRLKLALTKATEENRKYRVHKARLEGELLRADGKIEALIAQIAIPPGRRCEWRWLYFVSMSILFAVEILKGDAR